MPRPGVPPRMSGAMLAAALQNAWVLGAFAAVFVVLALSMFGLYELQLPASLRAALARRARTACTAGALASVVAMGVLSALIVGPCVRRRSPARCSTSARRGDVVLGGAALFAMALGMGVPLLLVGVSAGALLPQGRAWMVGVKQFFGVLLLAVAIWISRRCCRRSPACCRGACSHSAWHRSVRRSWIAAALPVVVGIALLVGALAGSRDLLQPLAVFTAGTPHSAPVAWTRVASLDELEARLKAPGKPVMLDFYADWCVSCKEMEAFTFTRPERVKPQLDRHAAAAGGRHRQQRPSTRRCSSASRLFGPPGIIFFDADGREIKGLRVIGYQNAERFLKTLSRSRTKRLSFAAAPARSRSGCRRRRRA